MENAEINLKIEQEKTLSTPTLSANIFLKFLFLSMDLIYGFKRTLPKFKVIEILARYPYMAWELESYKKFTKVFTGNKDKDFEAQQTKLRHIDLGRKSQDNEQWHMVIIDEIMEKKGIKQGWLFGKFIPKVMAFKYYYFSNLLYKFKPEWSFAMNARFESHAEHQYMLLVKEHPEWEKEEVESKYFKYYPKHTKMADLFRRIGLDEREHMLESIAEYEKITGKTFNK